MVRRGLPAMLLAVSLTFGSAAAWSEVALDKGPVLGGPAPSATPVLSLRRVPDLVSRLVADARLGGTLDATLSDPALGPARGRTCLVVHHAAGAELYRSVDSAPLMPASNLKLVTATAVLDKLGPQARLRTDVRASQPPAGGVVAGDLWLVGGGDPLLATADFAAAAGYDRYPRLATPMEVLADRIAAAGVRRVNGRVMGDDNRYDSQRSVPTWMPSYVSEGQAGSISALAVNAGYARIKPTPLPAPAPATNGAAELTTLLTQRGVSVAGPPGEGRAPDNAPEVATIDSPPMSDIVAEMLQESDNTAAEVLTKELGFRFGGAGSTQAGLSVERQVLAATGLPVDQLSAVDGSGLDRSDRASCGLLLAILERAGPSGPLAAALPVAARSGTLRKRFVGSPAAGRLRAKTGSLRDAVALSGWVPDARGQSLSFSLLVNGLPAERIGTGLEDRVVSVLMGYPQGPQPDTLGPAP